MMNAVCKVLLGAVCSFAFVSCQQGFDSDPPYKGYKMAPYTLKGLRFVPMNVEQALHYDAVGIASHYEADGARGAIGQRLYRHEYYAAHRTLPLPCVARVTNLIDVSTSVAHKLRFHRNGLARVRIQVLSVGDGPYKRTL